MHLVGEFYYLFLSCFCAIRYIWTCGLSRLFFLCWLLVFSYSFFLNRSLFGWSLFLNFLFLNWSIFFYRLFIRLRIAFFWRS